MTRDRLTASRNDVAIPVMVASMTNEHDGMLLCQQMDEIKLFHAN